MSGAIEIAALPSAKIPIAMRIHLRLCILLLHEFVRTDDGQSLQPRSPGGHISSTPRDVTGPACVAPIESAATHGSPPAGYLLPFDLNATCLVCPSYASQCGRYANRTKRRNATACVRSGRRWSSNLRSGWIRCARRIFPTVSPRFKKE